MAKISKIQLKQLVEAAIFVADSPLNTEQLQTSVLDGLNVSKNALNEVLKELTLDYQARGIQLIEVASGFRFQSVDSLSPWLSKLWQEQAPRYSRAMLEILSLIAYRQPITRGEIEDVRGVSVSSHIIKSLSERGWIKVVGHKEVPGRPSLYATSKGFLDYFSLKSLSELPSAETFVNMQSQSQAQHLFSSASANNSTDDTPLVQSDESGAVATSQTDEPEQLH
ncbi:SMC-Scp complex subunit ScpB [Paraglaciecola sp. 25GB23A]|uniref:SMC-Scp complex subunit ScpB n=1 Tax=Paraglaciecola sp. 25GB23A TaxID=3156068 RepID=UPI0032AF1852